MNRRKKIFPPSSIIYFRSKLKNFLKERDFESILEEVKTEEQYRAFVSLAESFLWKHMMENEIEVALKKIKHKNPEWFI